MPKDRDFFVVAENIPRAFMWEIARFLKHGKKSRTNIRTARSNSERVT